MLKHKIKVCFFRSLSFSFFSSYFYKKRHLSTPIPSAKFIIIISTHSYFHPIKFHFHINRSLAETWGFSLCKLENISSFIKYFVKTYRISNWPGPFNGSFPFSRIFLVKFTCVIKIRPWNLETIQKWWFKIWKLMNENNQRF